ncbi:phosphonate ABC transporter, permease protein PhnE [Polycladidibacter stylochi]|uniref:phosphonate ABC transporter, permease protein PhnE n=1 Tax=Polycladidibacter stylochi TaxID=1807766 RepID=UPI000830FB9B|nr:phosphonate ABC transporter, permease protein PhnE [Pseudovibrio stylochi]
MAALHSLAANPKLAQLEQNFQRLSRQRALYTFILIAVVLLSISGGLVVAADANSGSFFSGLSRFFDYPVELVRGAYDAGLWRLFSLCWHYLPYLIETINIALLATLIAFFLGGALSFLASRNLVSQRILVFCMRRVMDVTRAFPEMVIALLLVLIIGPSPVAAVMAVCFHSIGALAKQFSETNENADMRAVEGIASVGGNWLQQMRYGILPQVLPNFFSYCLLRLEVNVRASAILGFVGAGGLGAELKMVVDWNYGADILVIIFMLVTAISLIDYISAAVRRTFIGDAATL